MAHTQHPGGPPLFDLGQLLATPGAIATLERRGIAPHELLVRHQYGDWGDLDEDDRRENDLSVSRALRIVSAYGVADDPDRLWIITEADRSLTTILRPEEY